jgi:hypothetical protein
MLVWGESAGLHNCNGNDKRGRDGGGVSVGVRVSFNVPCQCIYHVPTSIRHFPIRPQIKHSVDRLMDPQYQISFNSHRTMSSDDLSRSLYLPMISITRPICR